MKKYYIILALIISSSFLLSGCSGSAEVKSNAIGAWYLTKLEDYSSGEDYTFDDEVLLFRSDATGVEILLPCDYYEEYSFITWKTSSSSYGTTIDIKHTEDYNYDLNILDISDSQMQCSFYYSEDPDKLYLATYSKMNENDFDYVGCWTYSEYYEDDEYFNVARSYLYLYPDGIMKQIYYEDDEQMLQEGSWAVSGSNLTLFFKGSDTFQFKTDINNNKLELYSTTVEGKKATYIYKRYYGLITNTPPRTYPQSAIGEINSFFATIFKRIAGNLSK